MKKCLALMLALVMVVALAACSKPANNTTDPTEKPADNNGGEHNAVLPLMTDTPAPTEEPTPTPTPIPTNTPIPWPTDPYGHIPPNVHIICTVGYYASSNLCIAQIGDDEYCVQLWQYLNMVWEIPIPSMLANDAHVVLCAEKKNTTEIVEIEHADGTVSLYYCKAGEILFYNRGKLGQCSDYYRELLVDHNVLIVMDYTWTGYIKKMYPESTFLRYNSLCGYWEDQEGNPPNLYNEEWVDFDNRVDGGFPLAPPIAPYVRVSYTALHESRSYCKPLR